jgi:uncharacterized coiled-coil DUF342 family protein
MESTNWQNQLTMGIIEIQYKLEDAKKHSDKNDQVKKVYDDAINATKEAREVIHRFVATYNNT